MSERKPGRPKKEVRGERVEIYLDREEMADLEIACMKTKTAKSQAGREGLRLWIERVMARPGLKQENAKDGE